MTLAEEFVGKRPAKFGASDSDDVSPRGQGAGELRDHRFHASANEVWQHQLYAYRPAPLERRLHHRRFHLLTPGSSARRDRHSVGRVVADDFSGSGSPVLAIRARSAK